MPVPSLKMFIEKFLHGVPINTLPQDWFVHFRASLIAGLRYKMEQWNTKRNGAVKLHSHS